MNQGFESARLRDSWCPILPCSGLRECRSSERRGDYWPLETFSGNGLQFLLLGAQCFMLVLVGTASHSENETRRLNLSVATVYCSLEDEGLAYREHLKLAILDLGVWGRELLWESEASSACNEVAITNLSLAGDTYGFPVYR